MLDSRDNSSPSKIDRVLAEVIAKQERGEHINLEALLVEHGDIAEPLLSFFENAQVFPQILGTGGRSEAGDCARRADQGTEIQDGRQDIGLTTTVRSAVGIDEESVEPDEKLMGAVKSEGMFDRYRIERLLGDGGMGAVYLAHDTLLNRPVALKTPKFGSHNSAILVERFRHEAQAAAKLHHRNLCPVYDVGRCEGIDYLTMAYINGKPLSAYISRRRVLDQRQVALIIRRLALGLQAAHEAGVIHRDLKPSNVMIDGQGEPILMDFGLASRIETSKDSRLTASGSIVGTPAYMSPEQVRGAKQEVGPQSDIYSLGVMFYELLTGRLPFRGSSAEVMGKILIAKPPRLQQFRPDVDDQIAGICERMMSKSRKSRFGSMTEVAGALTDVIRRLRLDDSPKPPIVQDAEEQDAPAGNTATELAAIAAEAARDSKRSSKSWSEESDDSQQSSGWRNELARFGVLAGGTRILVGIALALSSLALCLVLLNVGGIIGHGKSIVHDGEEAIAGVTAGPTEGTQGPGVDIGSKTTAADEDTLRAIYRGFAIENPVAVDGPFSPGATVTVSFDLSSNAEIDLEDPRVRAALDAEPSLGFGNLWIERLGGMTEIPGLEEQKLRDHSRYLLSSWDIGAAELIPMPRRRSYQRQFGTESFPEGAYRCCVEYVSPHSAVSRQAFVEFELKEATPAAATSETVPEVVDKADAPADPPILVGVKKILGAERPKNGGRAVLPRPSWWWAPASTCAMSVVPNMKDFSDKLDALAKVMRLKPPGVLQRGMDLANIAEGLKRGGTLMWLYGKPKHGDTPVAYVLPSTSHSRLISGMQPKGEGPIKDVIAERMDLKAIEMNNGYSAFARPRQLDWLADCVVAGGGFDLKLGAFNDFLLRQDIGFAVTREFIEQGVSVEMPFAMGDYVIPDSMSRVADDLFDFTGFEAVGGGTAIKPGTGVQVSLAAAIDAGSDMGSWSKTMQFHRDHLVSFLPSGQAAFVLGVSSCERWNDWLEPLCKKGCDVRFGDAGHRLSELINLDSLRGATLLISANPGIPEEQLVRQIHLQVHVGDARQAMEGSYSFLRELAELLKETAGATEMLKSLNVSRLEDEAEPIVVLDLVLALPWGGEHTFLFSVSPLNQNTLVIQGGDPDDLKSVLNQIANGKLLRDDSKIRTTLSLIADDAQQVILLNAAHASKMMMQFADFAMPAMVEPAAAAREVSQRKEVSKKIATNVDGKSSTALHYFLWAAAVAMEGLEPPSSSRNPFASAAVLMFNDWDAIIQSVAPLGKSLQSGVRNLDQAAHTVRQAAVAELRSIEQVLAPLRDAPPIGVGNRFHPTHVELNVVAPEELLSQVARSPAFAYLQRIISELHGG